MYHGKITRARKKRKYAMGGVASETSIGEDKRKKIMSRGGNPKIKLLSGKYANVALEEGMEKCEIISLVENPANKDFSRRNIITKGAIIAVTASKEGEIKVRVTSKPGKDGVINAVPLL
ncbi:MAG: 30S ribosomal protein S8e [Candidatus Altiarchaeales archaeon]|nr:30S ribosomal protein S8e [Candidatus Altiarchaeales archaeon]